VVKQKTGLGVEAFFPNDENKEMTSEEIASSPAEPKKVNRESNRPRVPGKNPKPNEKIKAGKEDMIERRPAWIRVDHLERLDALKHRERKRLRREAKRVTRSTLIDEAIEHYLLEMEE